MEVVVLGEGEVLCLLFRVSGGAGQGGGADGAAVRDCPDKVHIRRMSRGRSIPSRRTPSGDSQAEDSSQSVEIFFSSLHPTQSSNSNSKSDMDIFTSFHESLLEFTVTTNIFSG